jgi:TPP-dependent indolepyruvate ferredoxin oxidoreductase alpha subunit
MLALANAVQHQTPITDIMDNGWTSMTGMQINRHLSSSRAPEMPA